MNHWKLKAEEDMTTADQVYVNRAIEIIDELRSGMDPLYIDQSWATARATLVAAQIVADSIDRLSRCIRDASGFRLDSGGEL